MTAHRRSAVLLLLLTGAMPAGVWGQNEAPRQSLAEMAAQAKTKKAEHAHIVLDDDSQQVQKPLIPDIWAGDCENSTQIMEVLTEYRRSHTKADTEKVMHDWYDRHAERLTRALDENRRLNYAHNDFRNEQQYGYETMKPGDYQQYYEAQLAESRHVYDDRSRYTQNAQTVYHIESVFQKVKWDARRINLDFDWFKLRCGMNFCSY